MFKEIKLYLNFNWLKKITENKKLVIEIDYILYVLDTGSI
jgi:hypothetical protein